MKECQLRNGKTLLIREARVEDASQLVDYIQKVGIESDYLTFGPGEFVLTVEEEEKLLRSKEGAENELMLCGFIDGKLVGNLSFLTGTRPRVRHTGEFGLSIVKEYWGLGVGTELLQYLLEWAQTSKVIRKINLRVRSDHDSAIKLYTKLGFVKEGLESRGLLIQGQFFDFVHMGLEI